MDRFRLSGRPLVHGYLCFEDPADDVAAWTREITDYALRSGYEPGSIFMDHDKATGGLARGGFIELLSALRLPDSFGVVVPSLAHLSSDLFTQQVLIHMVQLTDSQVLLPPALNGGIPTDRRPTGLRAAS